MIITISGPAGSGKSTAAKKLAKKLHFRHYSIGNMRRRMAYEKGITLRELNKMGEKSIFSDKEVDDYQKELGKNEGDFVIDGRLSFHFIPHSVKIYLEADKEVRAKRLYKDERKAERYEDIEEAMNEIDERDKSDLTRYERYYHINCYDKRHFDLIIDTSKTTIRQTVKKIMKFLKRINHL